MGRGGSRGGGGGSRGGSFGGSRGGSFGGGRSSSRSSSSFGGGRSSSSFGSSRSYSGGSSRRSYSSGGGLFGFPRASGPIIINNSGNRNYQDSSPNRKYNNGPVYTGGGNNQNKQTNQDNTGCIHIALILIMVCSVIVMLFNTIVIATADREQKTPLAKGSVIETGYYTDELNWINDKSDLLDGMEYFYEKTGVQPYLYITDDVGGEFYDVVEDFANDLYDELFEDEAHLLFIFWEQDYYNTYCLSGVTANTLIDYDAREILLNKVDEYYWDSSLDEDVYFSKCFREAADEIMAEPPSAIASIAIPLIIFIIALVAEIMIRKKAKDAQKEKELKEMLDKPLETFGSTEAQDLAKKYEETEQSTIKTEDTEMCRKCGNVLEDNSNFCSSCGEKVDK